MTKRRRQTVAFGLVGPMLDRGEGERRWDHWRPSVSLCQHEDLLIDRYALLFQPKFRKTAQIIAADVRSVSPETEVQAIQIELRDPWDFEEVYEVLHDQARALPFDPEREDLLVHITTGSHVAQICLFLLTEARYLPGRLIQTSPPKHDQSGPGSFSIIDLDLSRYDRIASRFRREFESDQDLLRSGIATRNAAYNRLIERIGQVALCSHEPILLLGETGVGKSQLARRIYELKRTHRRIEGALVEVNCATIRSDQAMSALFGHRRGAFTGATHDRPGLLRTADQGLLFLDEIGDLGLDEQAMLLRAIEERRFLPLGADREVSSTFELICGTNRDLGTLVRTGRFREDLLARIDLWTFRLPSLRERPEDIAPNLRYELDRFAERQSSRVTFSREAEARFLAFAAGASWRANFRDLNGAVARLATLAPGGRVTLALVEEEIATLETGWRVKTGAPAAGAVETGPDAVESLLGSARAQALDRFELVQLAEVLRVCAQSRSLSEAGRVLFAASRQQKANPNDADRLRKYLNRFNLSWDQIHPHRLRSEARSRRNHPSR